MTDTMTIEEFHEYQATGKLPQRYEQQTRSSVLARVAKIDHNLAEHAAKKRKTNEADFQKDVIKTAVAMGWKVHHEVFSLGTKPGYPDLTMAHPNHGVLWLELKGPRGTVSAEQQAWIEALQDAGQNAYVVFWDQWDVIEELLNGREVAS